MIGALARTPSSLASLARSLTEQAPLSLKNLARMSTVSIDINSNLNIDSVVQKHSSFITEDNYFTDSPLRHVFEDAFKQFSNLKASEALQNLLNRAEMLGINLNPPASTESINPTDLYTVRNAHIRAIYLDALSRITPDILNKFANATSLEEKEAIAKEAYCARRGIGADLKSYMRSEDLAEVTKRNIEKYGDPLGPTFEDTYNNIYNRIKNNSPDMSEDDIKTKTYESITKSALNAGGKDLQLPSTKDQWMKLFSDLREKSINEYIRYQGQN